MDQSSVVPNDSTSNIEIEIPNKKKIDLFKEESDCLVQSEIYIKTEPQEDESEFQVIAGTYEMCNNYGVKLGIAEPMVKIECEEMFDGSVQDPLNFSSHVAGAVGSIKEHISSSNSENDIKNKMKEFESNEKLSLVEKKQIGENNNHTCHVCYKLFKQKFHLYRHMRIHTGEKPYTCHICKKSFNRKDTLSGHMLIHSDEKPYACDVCEKVFRDKSVLSKHKLIHTELKPFSCNECTKSFRQKNELYNHKRIHTGDKPFVCDLCEKAFSAQSNLIAHRRLHTEEKPYFCNVCNKSFKWHLTLTRHKKIHKK